MHIFDILGPVMTGPSSSHTAGAARIGYVSYRLLDDMPAEADIYLHGSFATTGTGHGTDRALIAGLLGMKPDDTRIPDSFAIARERGLSFSFSTIEINDAHPNTALLRLVGKSGKKLEVQAASIGGGRIRVQKLDGVDLNFSLEKPTLIVHNMDKPGCVAAVAGLLSDKKINIASMQLYRDGKHGRAVMVLETDQFISPEAAEFLSHTEGILKVTYFNSEEI